ncbi:MAG: hypothetical protein K0R57_1476 [Paenibacillaceae bacterium]|jgi:hypothetical protein|nr:hypothetical protein [Paenibacillaceae bacterium]
MYRPYHLLLDYAGLDGAVEIPGPEDCRSGMINAMSWWTPIENGAFFSGLYLAGLTDACTGADNAEMAPEASRIASGLLLLSEVGETPGFIARSVSTDGRTHYLIGSEDQTVPWFYGLWKYARSGLPSSEEAKAITARLVQVAGAIERNGWKLPCDGLPESRGELCGGGWRSAVSLLFITRALHDLTGEEYWLEQYRIRLHERPEGQSHTRLQMCEGGATWDIAANEDMGTEHFWVLGAYQAEQKELYLLEEAPEVREIYRRGLLANAYLAYPFIPNYSLFPKSAESHYEVNWRLMSDMWQPQHSVAEAVSLALEQFHYWETEVSPRRTGEASYMREPLFACWIVALSCDEALIERAGPMIGNCVLSYDWKTLYTSLFFIVVNISNEWKSHPSEAAADQPNN